MSEVRAVIEKEWREQYYRGRKFTGQFWWTVIVFPGLALALGLVSLFLARLMLDEGIPALVVAMVPPFAALAGMQLMGLATMHVGVDSIAGERERHTLDTLLSSPVTTRDLFLGKLLLPALIAVSLSQAAIFLVGLISVFFVGPWVLLWMVAGMLAVLVTILPNTLGGVAFAMIFSARSESVKSANQKMAYAMIPFNLILPAVVILMSNGAVNPEQLPLSALIAIGVSIFLTMLLMSAAFIVFAYRGFKRERLILA
ncbi:MAG: ABC transporter permease subunit [Thermoplasmatota archaeon]